LRERLKIAAYLCINKVVSIVGGEDIEYQRLRYQDGCEIMIATPGRLLDLLQRRYLVLSQCNYVVLDEADRMIDMGFEPQVAGILGAMPWSDLKPRNEDDEELEEERVYRTTYMFSATMAPAVEQLVRKYLRNPVVVTIGTPGMATDLITQNVVMLKESEKMTRLKRILRDLRDKAAIVFCNTKNKADSCARGLENAGFHVAALHGDMSRNDRSISLEGFLWLPKLRRAVLMLLMLRM
jgi:ATP-dependent RNA helicase DDX23/PRP28